MTAVTFGESSPEFEHFVSWYRKRPTQLAFAVSLALHALLITFIPGFRSVPLETPNVLTVRIVNDQSVPEPVVEAQPVPAPEPEPVFDPQPVPAPEPVFDPQPVPAPVPVVAPDRLVAPEPVPAPQPMVRREQPLPQPVAAPDFVASVPQSHAIEQTPVIPRRPVEPQPAPVLRQPESPVVEPVERVELTPSAPRAKPHVKPTTAKRPDLAPERPVVPVIESPAVAQIEKPVRQKVEEVRRERPVVRPAPGPAQSEPRPELPRPALSTPVVQAAQIQPPVAAAPAAPAPPPEAASVEQVAPQRPLAVAPPSTTVAVIPSAPAPVAGPAPVPSPQPQPAMETVESSVLDAYRQAVSQEVMRHMRYPRVAVMRKWQGKAVVEMQLSADGAVTQLVVVESSGKEVLDEAAIAMVRSALPLPKPPQGVRTVKVPVVFRLQG